VEASIEIKEATLARIEVTRPSDGSRWYRAFRVMVDGDTAGEVRIVSGAAFLAVRPRRRAYD